MKRKEIDEKDMKYSDFDYIYLKASLHVYLNVRAGHDQID